MRNNQQRDRPKLTQIDSKLTLKNNNLFNIEVVGYLWKIDSTVKYSVLDELIDLAFKAFTPSKVPNEPKIHSCRAKEGESPEGWQDQPVKHLFCNGCNEDRGNVLIRVSGVRGRIAF
jgi:hypothetical protein